MLTKELNTAEELVREAGRIVLEYYQQDYQVYFKNEREPVTQADKASNAFITERLGNLFPDYGILAEESIDDSRRLGCRRVWLVDPMDGTQEFIDKVGQFSIMVGLIKEGRPILGVVYQPTSDTLYSAAKNMGAFVTRNGKRSQLRVSQVSEINRMRLVVSRSHRAALVDSMKNALGLATEVSSGSVGLKVGLLVESKSDLYLHPNSRTKEWDTCAPEIILLEAGGKMTDLWGEPLEYNKPNVYNKKGFIASNGQKHFEIIQQIKPFLNQLS
ncbi:MAG: 3'(2'),5'-bisphosphate nucleotidase CysQ [bacterium]